MRPVRALIIYIVVVFVGGALLAPWLYWLAQHFAGTFPGLADSPFHRFVNRSLLVLALLGLWPLLKNLGASSARDVGLVRPSGQWKNLAGGFVLGFVSLAIIAGFALAFGSRQIHPDITAAKIGHTLLSAALTAAAVAFIEEVLFRGGIFGGLRRVFDWRFALLLSSMIYAIVHFLARTKRPETVTWLSGLEQLGLMLRGFTDWQQVIPGFFNLTLAGALLAFAYHRTGSLYFSIGLHGGWVFWLKCYGALTVKTDQSNTWLFGSEKMTNGWIALPVLGAALLLLAKWPSRKQTRVAH